MKVSSLQTSTCFAVLIAAISIGLFQVAAIAKKSDKEHKSKPAGSFAQEFCSHKVVDLTQTLGPDLPNFQGDAVGFSYKRLKSVDKDGYSIGEYSTVEHYGTHMDAPSHFAATGATIDQVPADKLILPCVVIDVRDEVKKDPDYCLTVDKLNSFEKGGKIPQGAAVLLLTGWQDRWNDKEKYRNADAKGVLHWPSFGKEAAELLVNERHVNILGVDTLSIDPGNSTSYPVHSLTLQKGVCLLENLHRLDELPSRDVVLFCGAIPVKGGTGSQARVLAVLP